MCAIINGAPSPAHRHGQPLDRIEEEKEMETKAVEFDPILQAQSLEDFMRIAFDVKSLTKHDDNACQYVFP